MYRARRAATQVFIRVCGTYLILKVSKMGLYQHQAKRKKQLTIYLVNRKKKGVTNENGYTLSIKESE